MYACIKVPHPLESKTSGEVTQKMACDTLRGLTPRLK